MHGDVGSQGVGPPDAGQEDAAMAAYAKKAVILLVLAAALCLTIRAR
jgi:hypothetical protein